MKLDKFEILSFRSLQQVECNIDPRITVLAGKNESGKTNILDALERITNPQLYNVKEDNPQGEKDVFPIIRLTFSLTSKEIEDLNGSPSFLEKERTIHTKVNFSNTCSKELIVTRDFKEKSNRIGGTFLEDCMKCYKVCLELNAKDFNNTLKAFNLENKEMKILERIPLVNSRNLKLDNENHKMLKEKQNTLNQTKYTKH